MAHLAAAVSEYVLRYGPSDAARDAVVALEEALSDYALRYGLTEQARHVMASF
jgi:hypothetical protein